MALEDELNDAGHEPVNVGKVDAVAEAEPGPDPDTVGEAGPLAVEEPLEPGAVAADDGNGVDEPEVRGVAMPGGEDDELPHADAMPVDDGCAVPLGVADEGGVAEGDDDRAPAAALLAVVLAGVNGDADAVEKKIVAAGMLLVPDAEAEADGDGGARAVEEPLTEAKAEPNAVCEPLAL